MHNVQFHSFNRGNVFFFFFSLPITFQQVVTRSYAKQYYLSIILNFPLHPFCESLLKKKKHRKKNDTHCTEYVNIHIIIKIFHQTFLHLSIIVFIIKTHHYKIKIKHSKALSFYYLKSILPNIHNSIVRNILTKLTPYLSTPINYTTLYKKPNINEY